MGSLNGVTNVSASGNGLLVYGTSNLLGQFRWFDRTGRPLGNVGEPGEYNAFRLSGDGRRAAASRNYPQGSDLWLMDTLGWRRSASLNELFLIDSPAIRELPRTRSGPPMALLSCSPQEAPFPCFAKPRAESAPKSV